MMEVKMWFDADEMLLLSAFVATIDSKRQGKYATALDRNAVPEETPSGVNEPTLVTPPKKTRKRSKQLDLDVPPVSLGDAVDEVRAAEATTTPSVVVGAPAATATEADAIAAMQAAVARGVDLPKIVALLAERNVTRVTQLSPEDRATFVTALS